MVIDTATDTKLRIEEVYFMKIQNKKIVHGNPTFSRGPLSFYINLCNPGECRTMRSVKKIPQNDQ